MSLYLVFLYNGSLYLGCTGITEKMKGQNLSIPHVRFASSVVLVPKKARDACARIIAFCHCPVTHAVLCMFCSSQTKNFSHWIFRGPNFFLLKLLQFRGSIGRPFIPPPTFHRHLHLLPPTVIPPPIFPHPPSISPSLPLHVTRKDR